MFQTPLLGSNGVGNRWANKKYNYSVIYSKNPPKTYSENDNDEIPSQILLSFLEKINGSGIVGIYVHSTRINVQNRPIKMSIKKEVCKMRVLFVEPIQILFVTIRTTYIMNHVYVFYTIEDLKWDAEGVHQLKLKRD